MEGVEFPPLEYRFNLQIQEIIAILGFVHLKIHGFGEVNQDCQELQQTRFILLCVCQVTYSNILQPGLHIVICAQRITKCCRQIKPLTCLGSICFYLNVTNVVDEAIIRKREVMLENVMNIRVNQSMGFCSPFFMTLQ